MQCAFVKPPNGQIPGDSIANSQNLLTNGIAIMQNLYTMSMFLGGLAKEARKTRGMTLLDVCATLEDLGITGLHPSTLKRMEDGDRSGDPRTWGKLWEVLRLPLRDLYEGLGLPVPSF